MPVPAVLATLQNNKMQTVLFLFFVSSFSQKLLVTGAFEVSYNGQLIFSKLESGQVPSGPMIEDMLNRVMRLQQRQQVTAGATGGH